MRRRQLRMTGRPQDRPRSWPRLRQEHKLPDLRWPRLPEPSGPSDPTPGLAETHHRPRYFFYASGRRISCWSSENKRTVCCSYRDLKGLVGICASFIYENCANKVIPIWLTSQYHWNSL